MSDREPLTTESRPRLASFVRMQFDKSRDAWILQAPERVLVLNETSKEILDRCTGEKTIAALVDELVKEFDAPRDLIEEDVLGSLSVLWERRFLEEGTPS